jgi:orotidine-5'-phosphate decarboxylase
MTLEAAAVGAVFLVITPGVRWPRLTATKSATPPPRAAGADAIVVRRPVRDAVDRKAAAERFVRALA